MSTKASRQELASSILEFVESGAYPEADNVVSTELSSAALPVILDVVEKAESDLKVGIHGSNVCTEIYIYIDCLPSPKFALCHPDLPLKSMVGSAKPNGCKPTLSAPKPRPAKSSRKPRPESLFMPIPRMR
jgi:hypothetical protein